MKNNVLVNYLPVIRGTVKHLPASKSISNRVLILNALSGSASTIHNLSEANDTRLMHQLLNSGESVLDVEDAGTTMRFLTAFCAISGKEKVITGTERMKQRPLLLLVNALRQLGAEIEYLEKDGYPPIAVKGFSGQRTSNISIRGDVSSQYISALMMVAPALPEGLNLSFEGKVTSKPYIDMTASLMKLFGATIHHHEQGLSIPHQVYKPTEITIESDWSAISYWFAFVALAREAEIRLPNITLRSLQGDRVIVDIMELLGVKSEPRGNDLLLIKKEHQTEITWDFKHCPDLAQTVSVVCAAKGIHGNFSGLESLRIKETDRIAALQTELAKLGAKLEDHESHWKLIPSTQLQLNNLNFHTYLDHRMAMAFAPLATLASIKLDDPAVVRKSYPRFWEDLKGVGFKVEIEAV